MGLGIFGVLFDGLVEEVNGAAAIVGIELKQSAQIEILCRRIDGAIAGEAGLLLRGDVGADLVCNGLGNFSLPGEAAGEIALIRAGPDGAVAAGVNELGADLHLVSGTQ